VAIRLGKVKIIDFSRVLSGPYATLILGDLGADIIKVEEPLEGDATRENRPFVNGQSHYFLSLNRNKKSLGLNLKSAEGKAIALKLAQDADVVVENFRPGKMQALGLDYETLSKINPRLIYCSISGFGQDGALAQTPAYNDVVQGLSGVMSMNGEPDGMPVKVGIPIGDLAAGMFAAMGVLAALYERTETGKGAHIDISMLDCLLGMLGYSAGWYFATGKSPHRVGSRHHSIAPVGVFRASDGKELILAVFITKFWRRFCEASGRPDLITDERFAQAQARVENAAQLYPIIEEIVAAKPLAEWLRLLSTGDVPHAPVLSVGEALEQDYVRYRNMKIEAVHPSYGPVKMVGPVIKTRGEAPAACAAPPMLGEHSDDILRACGYSDADIARLREAGVIGKT
jgi:crotonobetainyl-CoA:carnitine CoA-transferase CaiB-like acyl-CoA transferase